MILFSFPKILSLFYSCLVSKTMYCSVCFKLLVGVDCFPTDISFEKTKFLFANGYNLEITYGLGIRHVSTSSNSRAPFCAEQYRPCACSFNFCEFMCVSLLLCLADHVLLVSSIHSGFLTLSAISFPGEFTESLGEGFDGDFQFKTVFQSVTPYAGIAVGLSICSPFVVGGSFSDYSWARHWSMYTAECFCKIQSQVLCNPSIIGYGFFLLEMSLGQIRILLITSTRFVLPLH